MSDRHLRTEPPPHHAGCPLPAVVEENRQKLHELTLQWIEQSMPETFGPFVRKYHRYHGLELRRQFPSLERWFDKADKDEKIATRFVLKRQLLLTALLAFFLVLVVVVRPVFSGSPEAIQDRIMNLTYNWPFILMLPLLIGAIALRWDQGKDIENAGVELGNWFKDNFRHLERETQNACDLLEDHGNDDTGEHVVQWTEIREFITACSHALFEHTKNTKWRAQNTIGKISWVNRALRMNLVFAAAAMCLLDSSETELMIGLPIILALFGLSLMIWDVIPLQPNTLGSVWDQGFREGVPKYTIDQAQTTHPARRLGLVIKRIVQNLLNATLTRPQGGGTPPRPSAP